MTDKRNKAAAVSVQADHREQPSGIPAMLQERGASVSLGALPVGDYVINREVVIERKSGVDFVQSLISNRLFQQCARLKQQTTCALLLIEGDPLDTPHRIHPKAVRGAILSILVSWQLPILFTAHERESAELMVTIGRQASAVTPYVLLRKGHYPKKLKGRRLRFLQGLPEVGPVLAHRLIKHFGNIQAVLHAPEEKLLEVEGIGRHIASGIRRFLGA